MRSKRFKKFKNQKSSPFLLNAGGRILASQLSLDCVLLTSNGR